MTPYVQVEEILLHQDIILSMKHLNFLIIFILTLNSKKETQIQLVIKN